MIKNRKNIKILLVEGIYPSQETIASSLYPYSLGLRMVYREDSVTGVSKFLDFVKSEKGRSVIEETRYKPALD